MTTPTIKAAAKYFGVSVDDILSRRRHGNLIIVRAAIALIMRHRDGQSYPTIARRLNRDDHTTAINLLKRGWGLMVTDDEFGAFVDAQLCAPKFTAAPMTPADRDSAPPAPIELAGFEPRETPIYFEGLNDNGFDFKDVMIRHRQAEGSRELLFALRVAAPC